MLLQLEGLLRTLPLALFPVSDDQRLFEAVASTSAVVSLTLNRVIEQQAARFGQEARPHVLSAQWLEPNDRRRMIGLAHLHHGLMVACDKHGCRLNGLGGQPLASKPNVHSSSPAMGR
ncbi:MAG: hypothetical protein R3C19_10120 [Planctomycetaceae bacterium]